MARPALADAFAGFYAHELLLRWLGDGAPANGPGAVLNMIERVKAVGARAIAIVGRARPTPKQAPSAGQPASDGR